MADLSNYSVLILHNIPRSADDGSGTFLESDAGVMEEVEAVSQALKQQDIRHRIAGVKNLAELPDLLFRAPEPVVFNLVESLHLNAEDANYVPVICRAFGKSCTGNTTYTMTTGFDKWRSKCLFRECGLPCPEGVAVAPGQVPEILPIAGGKIIVKPVAADASEGITAASVIDSADREAMVKLVTELQAQFKQPVLIEQFIGERELNVSLLQQGSEIQILAVAEIDFTKFKAGQVKIVDYAAKWLPHTFEYKHTPRIIPALLTEAQAAEVTRCALGAWKALECHDYIRVDLRLDDNGKPFILEVNPNPDISPGGGFAAALKQAKLTYGQFVRILVDNALHRLDTPPPVALAGNDKNEAAIGEGMTIRFTETADREPIMTFLKATGFFRADELETAAEVLDEALVKGPAGHYQSFVLEEEGQPLGWVCYGPTPCSLGTYDIYWLAVTPTNQGRGYGRRLMKFAEAQIRKRSGRLVVVETSGRAVYDSTRAFYQRIGYAEAARLREFYAPGDDKVIYLKRFE